MTEQIQILKRRLLMRRVHFGLKSYAWASSIWNHKYGLRPKLHDTKFDYQFITAILKSQNSVSTSLFQAFR